MFYEVHKLWYRNFDAVLFLMQVSCVSCYWDNIEKILKRNVCGLGCESKTAGPADLGCTFISLLINVLKIYEKRRAPSLKAAITFNIFLKSFTKNRRLNSIQISTLSLCLNYNFFFQLSMLYLSPIDSQCINRTYSLSQNIKYILLTYW